MGEIIKFSGHISSFRNNFRCEISVVSYLPSYPLSRLCEIVNQKIFFIIIFFPGLPLPAPLATTPSAMM